MLVLEHRGEVLLEKRPAPGIWGGLWCFPEIDSSEELATFCRRRFGVEVKTEERLPDVEHGFTHFTLTISPLRLSVIPIHTDAREPGQRWLGKDLIGEVAKPAPVARILELVRPSS
jgi:A/G-specific adenine glycosylase